ncbi:MAG TPA: ATP-binding protein [Vicinamibacterales bacterium]|nr:ATP-binding protein [Vicinamibacterales bacterium]
MTDERLKARRSLKPGIVWLVPATLVALASSFALWDPLEVDERRHIRRLTLQRAISVRADLDADMRFRLQALVRLAETWAAEELNEGLLGDEWRLNSGLFLQHHPTDLALQLITPDLRVEWMSARAGVEQPPLTRLAEESLRGFLQPLRDRTSSDAVISPAMQLTDGTYVAALVVPVRRSSAFAGFLVALFDLESTIHTLLVDHREQDYAVVVTEGSHVLYRSPGQSTAPDQSWAQDVGLDLPGTEWRVRVWPNPGLLAELRSPLPELAVVLGALLGFLLTITLYLWRASRLTSAELRKAHDLLEARVQQRTAELQHLSRRLLQLRDEERRRIARELHDSTTQILGAVSMNLDTARKIADRYGDGRLTAVLNDGAEHVEQITQEIRTVSYLLHPPMLDELGLEYVLPWYVDGFRERSGIPVTLHVPAGFGRLPREIELTFFRIAQEALTNVHRHAGTCSARITLQRDADSATIEIRDDGRGMPSEVLSAAGSDLYRLGVGLAGMRERVRQLGGELNVSSGPAGTVIRSTITFASQPGESMSSVR